MRWLALDVGASRVGVAVCDDAEEVVTALEPIPFGGAVALVKRVSALAAARGCAAVALGVPRTRAGESRGERRVAAVAEALREGTGLEIVLVDETGTTRAAEERLSQAGVPRRRWPALVDGVAATIILEDVLALRARARRSSGGVDGDGAKC